MTNKYRRFPYKISTCVWEVTLACCFNCKYCGSRGGKARENELTLEECIGIADQLADLGCRRVSLIGGEVFMRSDWRDIAEALTTRGIKTCIITNGFKMTEQMLDEIKYIELESVAVSIDGPERVHDAYRQEGSYKRALETVAALTEAGIHTSVISALRADNAPLLPELYKTLKNYKIFAWQIQACSPMGNACQNSVEVSFDAKKVLEFVKEHSRDGYFYIGVADNIGYFTEEEGSVRGLPGARFPGCGAGLRGIGIDSVGNVRGCESMYDDRFNEGNLRERRLEDIWTDPRAFRYNRKFRKSMLTGNCKGCEFGGECAGGCRSYDYFTTGRLYENPLCPVGLENARKER